MNKVFIYSLLAFSTLLNSACGPTSSVAKDLSSRIWQPGDTSPEERAYCDQSFSYSPAISISGKASYEYRIVSVASTNQGLLGIATEPKAIRHTQYEVLNAQNEIIQCGETDSSGNFSFQMPQDRKAYTLKIFSRSNNDYNKASIFIAPETNELYSLEFEFIANSSQSNIQLVAPGDGKLTGGAFAILDNIHDVFDQLKSFLNSNTTGLNPLLIPKADIYWEKGFNPVLYTGSNGGPLSFFEPYSSKIFILGGENGDVNVADTDHFDPSIVIHEYFHFLEQNISKRSSPGGQHDGDMKLGSRLAWSEGAAQFFQAAITNFPQVVDTIGNSDGYTRIGLKISVEDAIQDRPENTGEGALREFAVARFLWDIHDSTNESGDNLSGHFTSFWSVFANVSSRGFNTNSSPDADLNHFIRALDCNLTEDLSSNSNWVQTLNSNLLHLPAESVDGDWNYDGIISNSDKHPFTGKFLEQTFNGGFSCL